MLPEVVDAMVEASRSFVKMDELEARAGEIIASVTGAESGYVLPGAAAGLLMGVAASMARDDLGRIQQLPDSTDMPNQVIMQKGHRLDYDRVVRTAGAHIVEIGFPGETLPWELERAIGKDTAAVLHVANRPSATLPLSLVTAIAHTHDVPVLVDAAAALPPASNLQRFIREGADLVVFSGGKALRGPQASGIIAGRADLIRSIALQHQDMDVREAIWARSHRLGSSGTGRPYQGIGRPLKVGKEEVVGVLVALQAYAHQDQRTEVERLQAQLMYLHNQIDGINGLRCSIVQEFHGRPQPVMRVDVDPVCAAMTAADVVVALDQGNPAICVSDEPILEGAFIINPFSLQDRDPEIIARRLMAIMHADAKADAATY
jgi:L-seryl-tRNA(Ser) seleniumtransferase